MSRCYRRFARGGPAENAQGQSFTTWALSGVSDRNGGGAVVSLTRTTRPWLPRRSASVRSGGNQTRPTSVRTGGG
jgi:hypothetical protein